MNLETVFSERVTLKQSLNFFEKIFKKYILLKINSGIQIVMDSFKQNLRIFQYCPKLDPVYTPLLAFPETKLVLESFQLT